MSYTLCYHIIVFFIFFLLVRSRAKPSVYDRKRDSALISTRVCHTGETPNISEADQMDLQTIICNTRLVQTVSRLLRVAVGEGPSVSGRVLSKNIIMGKP